MRLCEDGKYHWIYEVCLYKDLSIFFLVWKIFFFIFLGIFGIIMIADAQWGIEQILNDLKVLGIVLAGFTVLTILGYSLYAAIMGGKYVVEFIMDETGINHKQVEEQAKKARKIAQITSMAGVATHNLTTTGIGMSARTEMYSEFVKVKRYKIYPRRGLIKLKETLEHNQVFVCKEDFEFVKDYIVSRCVNAK